MTPQTPRDSTYRDLSRLVKRLEQKLLARDFFDPELQRLRKSTYERNKVNANIEHARALLFRLEHDRSQNAGSPTLVEQSAVQQDLQEKRALIKRLQKRIDDLADVGKAAVENEDEEQSSDDEDLLNLYAPAISGLSGGLETKVSQQPYIQPQNVQAAATNAAANLSSALRSRRPGREDTLSPHSATATGSAQGDSAAVLGNITPFSPAPVSRDAQESPANTASLLEAHDSEQNVITDSLLTLASALKQSTLSFADILDDSNPLVDAAAQALDKNVTGMEAAGKRMTSLRRMTEGVGWWGRMNLFLRVGILWVVAISVGLVLPKLGF